MPGGIDVRLVAKDGTPLLVHETPFGEVLVTTEPSRAVGWFKAVTNSGVQTQTIVNCSKGFALYVTDIVVSADKTALSTLTVRFYDGTNAENIYVADTAESTLNIAIHPAGRTLGWDAAYIQLITDTANQAATCTVWYNIVKGNFVMSYAKWNALRGI